jgi:hypothetical protein
MLRRALAPMTLVLSFAAIAAPAASGSARMCVAQERCGSQAAARGLPAHVTSVRLHYVVPMRADGSQHGGRVR